MCKAVAKPLQLPLTRDNQPNISNLGDPATNEPLERLLPPADEFLKIQREGDENSIGFELVLAAQIMDTLPVYPQQLRGGGLFPAGAM
jgi:hypothetical protein